MDAVGAMLSHEFWFSSHHQVNSTPHFAGVAVIGAACVAGALLAEGDGLEDLGDRASETDTLRQKLDTLSNS